MALVKLSKLESIAGKNAGVAEILTTRFADPQVIRDLEIELLALARGQQLAHLVIDCGRVRQFSSMFLSMLLRLRATLGDAAALRVCALDKELQAAFQTCRMGELIPVSATADAAVAEIGSALEP